MFRRLAPALLVVGAMLPGCGQQLVDTVDSPDIAATAQQAEAKSETAAANPLANEAPEVRGCDFEAWSADRDPAGLNVRATPSASAAVVGKLPPPEFDADLGRDLHAGFNVLESRNGWFRISAPGGSGPDRDVGSPRLSGWISGKMIDFALQSDQAFEAPDPTSRVVARAWWDDKDGGHPISYRRPSECRGEWIRLIVSDHDVRERLGWVRGICAIEETSCDGVSGDPLSREEMPAY